MTINQLNFLVGLALGFALGYAFANANRTPCPDCPDAAAQPSTREWDTAPRTPQEKAG